MADDDIDSDEEGEKLSGKIRGIDSQTRGLTGSANGFARAITSAFAQGATGAKSFDSTLKSLGLRLSTLSLNLALKPLTSALGSGLEKVFSGLSGALSGSSASAQPFAKGGVIASPSFFPLGGRGLGLAGEAGPEAIMPLARGPDGRLGVAATGAGAPSVTVNIATPDADSFRRSETYLTGLIARAVARGQRGL
jgi:phage-related minor tail protein